MKRLDELKAGVVGTGFRELYRAVYTDVARGGPADEPEYPTFRDGHVENVLGDALALSNRERRWVEVPL